MNSLKRVIKAAPFIYYWTATALLLWPSVKGHVLGLTSLLIGGH